jgi:cellulose 1,4-beta-cellobiosidase
MGNTSFYGEGLIVDTTKPITVVTQFIEDGGELVDIKRFYVQDDVVIPNSESNISGVSGNSITSDFCDAQKEAFGDNTGFQTKGGLKAMGEALDAGVVLVMSVWDDHHSNMLWLDSTYPTDADPDTPGAARGTCATDSGDPDTVESENADASVTYSNIRVGPIGSTTTQKLGTKC